MTILHIKSTDKIKEYLGEEFTIKIPDHTTGRDVKEKIKDNYPEISDMIDKSRIIAGDSYLPDKDYITVDELYLFPPTDMY